MNLQLSFAGEGGGEGVNGSEMLSSSLLHAREEEDVQTASKYDINEPPAHFCM
jgi:hypothetical protein